MLCWSRTLFALVTWVVNNAFQKEWLGEFGFDFVSVNIHGNHFAFGE
jgi:hypothetical protein